MALVCWLGEILLDKQLLGVSKGWLDTSSALLTANGAHRIGWMAVLSGCEWLTTCMLVGLVLGPESALTVVP